MSKPYQVLIPLYTGFNTLDVNGPLDVLCNYALRGSSASPSIAPFNITTTGLNEHVPLIPPPKTGSSDQPKIADDTTQHIHLVEQYKHDQKSKTDLPSLPPTVQSWEYITMQPDITFDTAIQNIEKGNYDILLLPGSGGNYVDDLASDPSSPILKVVKAFMKFDNTTGKSKWLVSICTGAMLAGAAGAFDGCTVTTHFLALSGLDSKCKGKATVVRDRWVDGGRQKAVAPAKIDTRILSSGGISCGLDACLYLLSQTLADNKGGSAYDQAVAVAAMMDYDWKAPIQPLTGPYQGWTANQAKLTVQWSPSVPPPKKN